MRILVLALVFVLIGAGFIFAENVAEQEYSYEIVNNSGNPATTVIPITSIRPNVDKLSAYEVIPLPNKGYEAYIGVYDDTTLACTGERFGEKEASTGNSAGERFIHHQKILNGLVVIQGSNTTAMIKFVRE